MNETEIYADKKGPVLNNWNKIDAGTNIKESKIPVIGVDTKGAGLDIYEPKIEDEDKIGAKIKGPVLNNKNKIDEEINIKEPKIPVIGIETKEAGLDIHEPKIEEGMDIKEPSGNESNLFGSINNINEMKVNQNLSNINNEKKIIYPKNIKNNLEKEKVSIYVIKSKYNYRKKYEEWIFILGWLYE